MVKYCLAVVILALSTTGCKPINRMQNNETDTNTVVASPVSEATAPVPVQTSETAALDGAFAGNVLLAFEKSHCTRQKLYTGAGEEGNISGRKIAELVQSRYSKLTSANLADSNVNTSFNVDDGGISQQVNYHKSVGIAFMVDLEYCPWVAEAVDVRDITMTGPKSAEVIYKTSFRPSSISGMLQEHADDLPFIMSQLARSGGGAPREQRAVMRFLSSSGWRIESYVDPTGRPFTVSYN